MAKCDVCGKGVHFGNNVSHSHRRSNKIWKSNVKSVRCKVNGNNKRMYVCTSCLKSGRVERAQKYFQNGVACGLCRFPISCIVCIPAIFCTSLCRNTNKYRADNTQMKHAVIGSFVPYMAALSPHPQQNRLQPARRNTAISRIPMNIL